MIGMMLAIFLLIPETPWWLAGKGKLEKAEKILLRYNGHIKDYDVKEHIVSLPRKASSPAKHFKHLLTLHLFEQNVMTATIAEERYTAERNSEEGLWAIFRGRNLIRFFIAGWPKIVQQFVGLSVFNTYATYFCTSFLLKFPS